MDSDSEHVCASGMMEGIRRECNITCHMLQLILVLLVFLGCPYKVDDQVRVYFILIDPTAKRDPLSGAPLPLLFTSTCHSISWMGSSMCYKSGLRTSTSTY